MGQTAVEQQHAAGGTASAPAAQAVAPTPAELQLLEALWTPEWPEVWRDMSRRLYAALLAQPALAGVERRELAAVAVEQMTAVAELYGGSAPYIPSGHFLFKSEKARKIISEFKGRNLIEVARANDVTPRRVQQIVGAWQRAQFAAKQGALDF